MLRVILLLCFALASCQQATAAWPFTSGERSSGSNVDYTNSINSAISSLPSYISYVTSQQQSVQPQLLNTESEVIASSGHLGSTTEVKPSGVISQSGVKGVTRYPARIKGTSQQPVQQLQDFFSSQPVNIFSEGYLEPVVVGGTSSPTTSVITGTVNLTDGKEKEGGFFRSILPWRWVNRNGNGAALVADDSSVQQPSAPKRSWPWFFSKQPSRKTAGQQTPSANCFCIPAGFQPTTVNQPHLYQTDQQQQQQQQQQTQHQQQSQSHYSNEESSAFPNVRPVEPSPDFDTDGSNPVPIVVPAPSQAVNGQQQQQQPQQQQVQQTQVVTGGSGTDLLANHRPQQSQQQQQAQQFVQQFQPVPVVTNYQSAPQQQPAETGNQQTNSGQVANAN